jgi:hypothetical protein
MFLLFYNNVKAYRYINYWTLTLASLMFRAIWKKLKHSHPHGPHGELDSSSDQRTWTPSLETVSPSNATSFHDSVAKTCFPEFDLERGIPHGELTDVSDDDESEVEEGQEEKYSTKEDEDVAVFLSLANRMSLKSLLHLLQGLARSQDLSTEYLTKYSALADSDETTTTTKQAKSSVKKQFRFAEVSDRQVRVVVHEVESWKHIKELWMGPEEAQAIRTDLIETVQFFSKHRPMYTHSVEIVAKATETESVVENHMRQLTEDSFARGLEAHIVKLLSGNRKNTVRAVLQEQSECQLSKDNYEMTSHCLREQSLAYSQLSTGFAEKMGRCDQIIALKASMSRWRPSPEAPKGDFWDANNC